MAAPRCCCSSLLFFGEIKFLLLLKFARSRSRFSLVNPENVPSESEGGCNKCEHLQSGGCAHVRFLSTWMPKANNMPPTIHTKQNVAQLGVAGSKSSYSGANTSVRTPASLSASPPISAMFRFSCKLPQVGVREGDLYHSIKNWPSGFQMSVPGR